MTPARSKASAFHYPPEKWKGLWAQALAEKRSLYTNEAPPVPPGHPIIHNNLAAPILFQGEAIGLLNIANKESGYTDADRELLDRLAARVAPVLYAWIQRRLREDESKRAEQALREREARLLELSGNLAARNLELEAVNKEIESFTYTISHDLRAPVRSMTGFAEALLEDYQDRLDAQARDYLARISKGADKMTRLIDDLLRLSRISRQEVVRATVDLSALARGIVAELTESEPGRSVTVSVAEGITASADKGLMEIALANLLENAWKFTSKIADARIEFGEMTRESGKRIFYVRDNGAGFDPRHQDKMFRPFQRLHAEKEFAGTGIGLAIVERIIHRHGGRIWAEGAAGQGATFYFTLNA